LSSEILGLPSNANPSLHPKNAASAAAKGAKNAAKEAASDTAMEKVLGEKGAKVVDG
jgi:hypothetical protein